MSDGPIRFVVAVESGKGGVGKSTVSLHLALALARRGLTVGLLDADLYGPDIPVMVGVTRHERAKQWAEERSIWSEGVAVLGRIRLDPGLGMIAVSSAQSETFDDVAARVIERLEQRTAA